MAPRVCANRSAEADRTIKAVQKTARFFFIVTQLHAVVDEIKHREQFWYQGIWLDIERVGARLLLM